MRFLVSFPTEKMTLCRIEDVSENVQCKTCQITVIGSISGLTELGAPTLYTNDNIEIFLKDLELQIYVQKTTNFVLKNTMVERFDDAGCSSCDIKTSKELIFKVCIDELCEQKISQSTLFDKTQPIWFFFGYEAPIYNYNKEIQVIETYLKSKPEITENQLVSTGINITDTQIGTVKGKKVNFF